MFIEDNNARLKRGWIEVICGSMFSGKTEELITDASGSFSVDNVRNAPISAKVSAEGFDFDVANLNKVDPGVGFPVIAPARYLLTGKVERDSLPVDTEVSNEIKLLFAG